MVDLENKELLKIMWLPAEREVLFNIQNEIQIPITSKFYDVFSDYIDIEKWRILYGEKYHNWLNEDDSSIYDINNEINLKMIDALVKINKRSSDAIFFYWFDIDRTFYERFKWEYCPLSNKRLLTLGDSYPAINSFISPDYPLLFPSSAYS